MPSTVFRITISLLFPGRRSTVLATLGKPPAMDWFSLCHEDSRRTLSLQSVPVPLRSTREWSASDRKGRARGRFSLCSPWFDMFVAPLPDKEDG